MTIGPWDFHIERHDRFHVLRDDLIEGGSKRRALNLLIPSLPHADFVYAGTIFGHGALALALACRDHGRRAHLFLSSNDPKNRMIEKLAEAGADIQIASPLPISELLEQVKEFADRTGARLFPLAFDEPAFFEAMTACLRELEVSSYPEIWCARVSGTFARSLTSAYPEKPLRLVSTVTGGNAEFFAPEKYHRPAQMPPPYPACPYTDAKLWRFAKEHAKPDSLIWNIAG